MSAALAAPAGDEFLSRLQQAEQRDSQRPEASATPPILSAAALAGDALSTLPWHKAKPKGKAAAVPAAKRRVDRESSPDPAKKRAAVAQSRTTPAKKESPSTTTKSKDATPGKGKDNKSVNPLSVNNNSKFGGKGNIGQDIKAHGFKLTGPIASGAFSMINKALHVESGTDVAVKTFVKCTGKEAEEHERELQVLRLVSREEHAHIANLLGEFDSAQGGTHAMLFYCGGGSLHSYLGKLRKKQLAMTEMNAVVTTAQIGSALQYLHELGVAHRDVKPANVLYDGRRWRLCDFGFAIVCHDTVLKDKVGTPQYLAPEIAAGRSYLGKCVDMWAFGVMVYEMLHGRPAIIAPTPEDLNLRIKNGFKAAIK